MAAHNTLGKTGEDAAVAYLERNGYTINHRNWRKNRLELDIVAVKDGLLIVVAGDRHDEDHDDERRDETARGGHFVIEPQPSADLRAETRRDPNARHNPCKGAYLHDEALAPSVPDGQRQHEADD